MSYDIEENKVRTQLFKELESYGLKPIQKSVFWGFLNLAELRSIKRYVDRRLTENDKAFIIRTDFHRNEKGFFVGHTKSDFEDWDETHVI